MRRSTSLIYTALITIVIAPSLAGVAGADPTMPIPPEIPRAINAAVPPPKIPDLNVIPPIARTPDATPQIENLRAAMMPAPSGDRFFDFWPTDLDSMTPGQIISTRDVTATAAILAAPPVSSVKQIKFRTTDTTGAASIGTTTIVVPKSEWDGKGPRPVLVNNLPIDALGQRCTPGYTMSHGVSLEYSPIDFPPTTQLALARGYAVLIPDHQGPRMAYAEPELAGRIVLDSLRALTGFDPDHYGSTPFAMTGYSGGAIATNGATKMLDEYAPELRDRFVGAAFGGVPADFRMLAGSMNANLATGLLHAAAFGIARERPEILPLINNFARWWVVSPLKDLCTIPLALLGQTFLPMQIMSNDPDPFNSPVAEHIYEVTRMADKKAGTPIYIYNGAQEFWIPAAGARNLYREQCKLGANATYREVFGEHVIGAITGYPEALSWLDQRLHGVPAKSECGPLAPRP